MSTNIDVMSRALELTPAGLTGKELAKIVGISVGHVTRVIHMIREIYATDAEINVVTIRSEDDGQYRYKLVGVFEQDAEEYVEWRRKHLQTALKSVLDVFHSLTVSLDKRTMTGRWATRLHRQLENAVTEMEDLEWMLQEHSSKTSV